MNLTIWNRQTGQALHCEIVDAREILEHSPDLYTDVDPNPGDPPPTFPPIVSAADDYRRQPVGENPTETPIDGQILRNPTGSPRQAEGAPRPDNYFVRPKSLVDAA